jgi:histidine triad (HIT) family protein
MTQFDNDCLVCRKHRGETPLYGGIIFQTDQILISHAQPFGNETDHYLGHLFIETRRHVAELADLTMEEAAALGVLTTRLARALIAVENIVHVYAFTIVDGAPHMHVHVIGRYANAPRDYWGPKVDEWPLAPRGGEAEITQFADRIRSLLK